MASIEIDGISYEVEDEKLVEAINAKLAQLDAAAELMQKALDAVSAERDAAKEQVEGEPERIDSLISERIASRLALERQAGPHMGDLKCDGLSDREIRLQAVKQLTGKDLSSKDDGYLTVYSEITLENAVTRTDALDADLDSLQAVGQIPKAEVSEAAKRADATAKILENSKNRYSQEAV